jgi:TolA-binding protein
MVQDSTYFQNELRQKLNSINEEVNRMNGELETTQKENSNINQFEKKYKKV